MTATPAELIEAVVKAARPLHTIVGKAGDAIGGPDGQTDELMECARLALPVLAGAVQAARDALDTEPDLLEFGAAAVALIAESAPGSTSRVAGLDTQWIVDGAFGMLDRIRDIAKARD